MAVTVRVPSPLRPFAGGRDAISVEGVTTVGEVLDRAWTLHPRLRDRVLTEIGEVRTHVNIFVGVESIRFTGGLATPVADGAEVSILAAVSGGLS